MYKKLLPQATIILSAAIVILSCNNTGAEKNAAGTDAATAKTTTSNTSVAGYTTPLDTVSYNNKFYPKAVSLALPCAA